uniref:Transcriptional coactivator Hfi1/Transcriptional adapter 1 n=1 Tax=Salix viminalis TaxID=40686 RepID=A0A6N2KEZ4_SALVM
MTLSNQTLMRIDTLELKSLIVKKIGQQRADRYFYQLTRLLSSKVTKCEFDKFCVGIIGRENIPLHNRFIQSILKNACCAKVLPSKGFRRVGSNLTVANANGYQKNSLQLLYGDAFPSSPRKGRSPASRDRRFKDHPSPPGPLGKPQSVACEELNAGAQEQQSATELLSLGSRPPVEVASVEEGEEVEQMAGSPFVQSRSPVTAPLGISMNYSGSRKALSNASLRSNYLKGTCLRTGKLPDSRSLRHWLERKLQMESISMSLDSVNLLNNGLDAYLKRLIEPCMALAGSRHGNEYLKRASGQFIPGLNGALPGKYIHRETESVCASMLDFRVAMESNPQILGEDWPTQLEKISLHGFEE